MKVSVIIGYYKKVNYLELILQGLALQTFDDFEVIIAEDNNDPATKVFIEAYQKKVSFPLKVVQQEDKGFRKNRILNEAIRQSAGEVLVFFDGDCIPHKECIKEHYINTTEKGILSGRRVMLSPSITDRLLRSNKFTSLSYFELMLSGSKHIEESIYLPYSWIPKKKKRGLLGCNFSILKKALVEINGFDEDYEKAGVGEDSDIEWRLLKSGYSIIPIKFKAIVYHLHHDSNYQESDVQFNTVIMNRKMNEGLIFCINGLNRHA
jgi:cellulose synthase/poly-beta-1,6-N-acetylglucosamine synthase-like glycosyltransferase